MIMDRTAADQIASAVEKIASLRKKASEFVVPRKGPVVTLGELCKIAGVELEVRDNG